MTLVSVIHLEAPSFTSCCSHNLFQSSKPLPAAFGIYLAFFRYLFPFGSFEGFWITHTKLLKKKKKILVLHIKKQETRKKKKTREENEIFFFFFFFFCGAEILDSKKKKKTGLIRCSCKLVTLRS